jgi:hypothetical protein
MINSVPPTRSVSHYCPLLSLLHSQGQEANDVISSVGVRLIARNRFLQVRNLNLQVTDCVAVRGNRITTTRQSNLQPFGSCTMPSQIIPDCI